MLVKELIDLLQKRDPEATVVSFHEEAPFPMNQVQGIHEVNHIKFNELNWVVVNAKRINPQTMIPNTPSAG